uniref:Ig-like domain-containing protein n=1 Tax=Poecilia formosa TaxID=48698 RepID=A0A087X4U8_POEFO
MFTTNLNPTETPFQFISWDFDSSSGLKPIVLSIASGTTPEPEYEGRITLFLSTGSLELRNLTLNDSGNYIFSFRASGENLRTGHTTLHIYATEPVSNVRVSPLSADLIEFNSSVHLFCSSSGSSLSFIWTKDNSELTASDRVQINKNEENSTLTIANVIRNDKGLYRCHVSNPASSIISVPVNISVSYGPEKVTFSKEPPSQKYPEGSDIHLSCSADSRPNAIFNWFFNGNVLPGSGSQRELLNVQKNQSGNYSCQAFNTRTSRYQTSQILVIYIEDITTEESNPLPPGAIAGIAIACVVCVSLIVFGVYFILSRKRGKTSNR